MIKTLQPHTFALVALDVGLGIIIRLRRMWAYFRMPPTVCRFVDMSCTFALDQRYGCVAALGVCDLLDSGFSFF